MCGIAGFIGNYPPELADAMSDRVAHRGPDANGSFRDPAAGVALAHRRLSIIDLSEKGCQPMTDASGRFVMVYNGEVYNFPELRAELEACGHVFRGHSDSEIVLEHFARRGTDCLARLNGIFALAIWDRKDQILTLARDGLGVKPLYLTRTPRGLAFASEIKALLALPDLDKTLDRDAAAAYVTYLWSPGERTMFKSVRKLDPGIWLQIGQDGKENRGTFYRLPKPKSVEGLNDRELIARTTDMFERAVHRQMVTDVEVGAFLSGGLDSSAIVAFAKDKVSQGRMQCFTIDYESGGGEAAEMVADLPYAEAAAQHLGVTLHKVKVDASMASQFERLIHTLDEPQADPAALNNLLIAQAARERGIKVLLSGTGGDDLFTGYRRHQAARFDGFWNAVPSPLRIGLAAGARHLSPEGSARRVRKLLEGVGGDADERAMSYFEWLPVARSLELLSNGDAAAVAAVQRPMRAALAELGKTSQLERVLRLDQRFFLADHNLNYTDKTGMSAGVEIRVPFLDLELIDWAAQLPPRAKMRGRTTKWVLRKAMEPFLPREIIYRPKTGFGVPLRSWLRYEMRAMLEALLDRKAVESRGLFDHSAVTRLRDETFSGRSDGSYTLLAVMAIELWCQKFVDG